MRFQVPQFIEVENKIFGPLTLKQFIYLAGGAGISVVSWYFLPRFVSIIIIVPIIIFSLALAFYKVNNRPFIFLLESMYYYLFSKKLYIWKKKPKKIEPSKEDKKREMESYVPKLSDSKLKDLTWSLDIKESENPVTRPKSDDIMEK